MKKISIAIDGPAGAGKSTIARLLSQKLQYIYIDTGAMYRAIAWAALEQKANMLDQDTITRIAEQIQIIFDHTQEPVGIFANGQEVTQAVRSQEVTHAVPVISQYAGVREAMLKLQRKMAKQGGVVMDGRDIGSFVLPEAELKIFLTASPEVRAQRRCDELLAKGQIVSLQELTDDMQERDRMDMTRKIAPLRKAKDAQELDTSFLSINEVVVKILTLAKDRIAHV